MRRVREIEIGPVVAAAGSVLLIVSLFLDWFDDFSAFTVFEVLDLMLLALALAALVAIAEATGIVPGAPLPGGAALPLGLVALVIVASQLINHPPAGIDREVSIGLWLALGGSALMVLGSVLATQRISLAVDVERRERRRSAPSASTRPPHAPAEARQAEPEVKDELYPEGEREGPIGADDPETRRPPPPEEHA
jgi:hypothetical protein